MDARLGNVSDREYVNYEPETETIHEDDSETLLLHLPGFKKHQLRIQLTPTRTLKVSGERLIGGNKWSRLLKEYQVSAICDLSKISAKLEDGILQVKQPKLITPVTDEDKEKKPESEPNQKPHEKTPTLNEDNARTEPSPVAHQQPKHVERKTSEPKHAKEGDIKETSDAERIAEENVQNKDEKKDWNAEGKVTRKPSDRHEIAKFFASRATFVKERRMLMNLFAGVLVALAIGVYATNWVKSFKKGAN